MNRKILVLNLALLALLGTLGWMLRAHWRETRARELATLAKAARRSVQLPPPSPAPPEAVVPANYLDVAQKTLFSKDRNPNVIIETVAAAAARNRKSRRRRGPSTSARWDSAIPSRFSAWKRWVKKDFVPATKSDLSSWSRSIATPSPLNGTARRWSILWRNSSPRSRQTASRRLRPTCRRLLRPPVP